MPDCRIDIIHWISGQVPADYDSNTIYFTGVPAGGYQALADAVKTAFFASASSGFTFYNQFYGKVVVYDMADAKPRPERATSTWTPSSPATLAQLGPQQVALCVSFYATRNLPRQRGRIYIGPFFQTNLTQTPIAGITGGLLALAAALHALTADGTWCVYSEKGAVFEGITNWWVDNRWDTQRRRLPKATARTVGP